MDEQDLGTRLHALADHAAQGIPPRPAEAVRRRGDRRRRRQQVATAAAGVVLAGAMAVGAVPLLRDDRDPAPPPIAPAASSIPATPVVTLGQTVSRVALVLSADRSVALSSSAQGRVVLSRDPAAHLLFSLERVAGRAYVVRLADQPRCLTQRAPTDQESIQLVLDACRAGDEDQTFVFDDAEPDRTRGYHLGDDRGSFVIDTTDGVIVQEGPPSTVWQLLQ